MEELKQAAQARQQEARRQPGDTLVWLLAGGMLLRAVLADFELEILETHPVEYKCYCSRERVTRALISMGRQELSALIEEQGQAELTCQFCDKVYRFSREELEELLSNM